MDTESAITAKQLASPNRTTRIILLLLVAGQPESESPLSDALFPVLQQAANSLSCRWQPGVILYRTNVFCNDARLRPALHVPFPIRQDRRE